MAPSVARISMFVAALAATALIAAPLALADPPYGIAPSQPVETSLANGQPKNLPPIDPSSALVLHRTTRLSNGTQFDWSAAAIGALAAAGACVLLFSVTFDLRRRRQPNVA